MKHVLYSPKGVLFIIFLLTIAFQATVTPEKISYSSFSRIEWENKPGCVGKGAPQGLRFRKMSMGTYESGIENEAECLSKAIEPKGKRIKIDYAGIGSGDQVYIEIRGEGGAIYDHYRLPSREIKDEWYQYSFLLPGAVEQQTFYIRLVDRSSRGWVTARNRVTFYSETKSFSQLPAVKWGITILFSAFLALLGAMLLSLEESWAPKKSIVFIVYLFLAIAVHLRFGPYFYWDEWKVIERFADRNIAALFLTHNEQFVPFFFAFYFIEVLLFGDHYFLFLILSLTLHALNALLVSLFFRKVLRAVPSATVISLLLGGMFVISGVHAEVLHWSILQLIELSFATTLAALLASFHYLDSPNRKTLLMLGGAVIVSPLFYAGGFITIGLLLVLGITCFPILNREKGYRTRFLTVLFISVVSLGVSALLYLLNRSGVGRSVNYETFNTMLHHLMEIPRWLFVGSQLGTVLRGGSIFVNVDTTEQAFFFSMLVAMGTLVYAGFIFCFSNDRKTDLGLIIVGEIVVILFLLLTAIGRVSFGVLSALEFRYHYGSVLGLLLIVSPLLRIIQRQSKKSAKLNVGFLILFLWTVFQVRFSSEFYRYSNTGRTNRNFVIELAEWNKLLRSLYRDQKVRYTGAGTELYGLFPIVPQDFAPQFYEASACKTVNFITHNKTKYPCANPEAFR